MVQRGDLVSYVAVVLVAISMAGCASHCGLGTYCDIPETWPVGDTFTVESASAGVCISGGRRSSCASRGMFQPGPRWVEIQDTSEDGGTIATLRVTGARGDRFFATCFQYSGDTFLGLAEVLTGVEISDFRGRIIATYPDHAVTRRSGGLFGC